MGRLGGVDPELAVPDPSPQSRSVSTAGTPAFIPCEAMRTLHTYFGRELLKTFLMTSAALTLLIVMGGGVANLFRGEGIGAGQMAQIVLYLTPVAVTLILPVAALFSSTITYGRATMDNEILACRAAGINIHRLLLAPLVLGLFVTVFTYGSWNYLIPYLTGAIEDITRRDLPSIVVGQFQKGKPLAYGKYRITANRCQVVPAEQLPEEVREGHTFLRLLGVAFLELEDQEVMRFGTADETIIDFDITGNTPRVTVDMQGGRSFDAARRQYFEFHHQILGPIDIPLPIKRKIKFETLGALLEYRRNVWAIPRMQAHMANMRRVMMSLFLNQDVSEQMDPDHGGNGVYRLKGKGFDLIITARRIALDEEDGRARLGDVHVRLVHAGERPDDVYTAELAIVELQSSRNRDRSSIHVQLIGDVKIRPDPAGPDEHVVKKNKETLPQVAFADQGALFERFESFDIKALFDEREDYPLFQKQERIKNAITKIMSRFAAKVRGEIHFRASYSLGAIAIVLLGALLGIIVRGGQVLTAFGISCVPMLFVIVASIVGRNLADRPDYSLTSTCVMWGSTLFMYMAATIVGARLLKR